MGVADEERFMDDTGQIIDDYRIEYIKDHLAYLWKAINEGCNIKGIIFGHLLIAGHGSTPIKTDMGWFHSTLLLKKEQLKKVANFTSN